MPTSIDRYGATGLFGSFWPGMLSEDERDNFTALAGLATNNNIMNQLAVLFESFTGCGFVNKEWTEYKFDLKEVYVTPSSPNAYPEIILPRDYSVENFEGEHYFYIIPFKSESLPILIHSEKGTLINKVNFFYGFEYLWFREDPSVLFTSGVITIKTSRHKPVSFQNYAAGTTGVKSNMDLVVNYKRNIQSPRSLKLALAALSGQAIIRKGGILRKKKIQENNHVIYEFDEEVVECFYPHKHLEEGKNYKPDTVIGNGIEVFGYENNNPYWYEKIVWNLGIPLDKITRFKGLTAPDKNVPATVVYSDPGSVNGSKAHVRFELEGEDSLVNEYWDFVHENETKTGIYLNSIIGINSDTPGASLLVNPVNVFFDGVLNKRALVVIIREVQAPFFEDVVQFLKRELPIGIVPIILVSEIPGVTTDDDFYIVTDTDEIITHLYDE